MASSGSRKEKSCACCKRYLEHLKQRNQNMTCFLRHMTADFKHSTIVPNRFLRHFRRELSGTIKLQSPNGYLYDVQVMKGDNNMVLGHGWDAFLDVHDIKENDYLLFRHIDKDSCFEVSIFDSDGCEKLFPCAGIRNTPSVRERSVDNADISSSSKHDTTEESSGSEISAGCEKGEGNSSESESFESDDLETPTGTNYVLSSRSHLSEEEEESVIAFIKEIQPEVTVYVAIIRKSHVQPPAPFLDINKEYALAHFPHETTTVTLQRPGSSKKWHPEFYESKDRSVCILRGKWLEFVRKNRIEEGDIFLLYPTRGARKFTFTVRLLRATAASSGRGLGGSAVPRSMAANNAGMDSEVYIKEEPTDVSVGEDVSSENGHDASNESLESQDSGKNAEEMDSEEHLKVETTDDGEHVSYENGHETSNESLESEDSGGAHQPCYIVPRGVYLTRSEKNVVEERVRAMHSELPIYVTIMWNHYVGASNHHPVLTLSSRYVNAVGLLPARGQTVLLEYLGKVWKTKMVIHCDRTRFGSGWPQFVRDNGLRVGDICLFQLKKGERKLTMAVDVIFRQQ